MDKSMVKGVVIGGIAMVVVAAGGVTGYRAMTKPKFAEVVAVKEAKQTITTPRQECEQVQVQKQAPVKDEHRATGTIVGGVAGGLAGQHDRRRHGQDGGHRGRRSGGRLWRQPGAEEHAGKGCRDVDRDPLQDGQRHLREARWATTSPTDSRARKPRCACRSTPASRFRCGTDNWSSARPNPASSAPRRTTCRFHGPACGARGATSHLQPLLADRGVGAQGLPACPRRRCGRGPSPGSGRRPRARWSASARPAAPRSPRRFNSRRYSATSSTILGARPSVGSSIMISSGSPISVRASVSICCSPPDSTPASVCWRSARRGNSVYMSSNDQRPAGLPPLQPSIRFWCTVRFEKMSRFSGT